MSEPSKRDVPKRPSGGQKANTNGIRHGLKAGQLPKGTKYIEIRINKLRREVESIVLADKGEITLTDAAYIQTAIRWERHAALAQRWLTKQMDVLKPADLLQFSREIARASAERDKAIAALGLNVKDKALPWLAPTPRLTNGDQQ